jgi:hypothetical protein
MGSKNQWMCKRIKDEKISEKVKSSYIFNKSLEIAYINPYSLFIYILFIIIISKACEN